VAAPVRKRRFFFEYAQAAVIAFIFALFVRTFLFQAFQIPSASMENTLLVGDHILVNKFALTPLALPIERAVLPLADVRRDDVIIFRFPGDPRQDYVKRVIGLPGDTIQIVDQVVYFRKAGAEGFTALLEPFAVHKDPRGVPDSLNNFGPIEIPKGSYFAMGDNRDDSLDSREWGFVPRENIIGRAIMVYWSFDGLRSEGAQAASREPQTGVRRILNGARAFVHATRWGRAGQMID
jgi:signal peptidase I